MSAAKEIHYYNYYQHKGMDLNWYRSFFPLRWTEKKTGEASPYYLFDPSAAAKINDDIPDVKLIVLLRNPIDRAYSAYNMNARRADQEFPSFEQAIKNRDMSEEASQIYLWRGLYAKHLKHWLRCFSRKQLLIIKAERFFREPKAELRRVYKFLELDESYPTTLAPQEVGEYRDLSPRLRAELKSYFEEPNQELVELLGQEFDWK